MAIARDEAALVIATAAAVQSVFAGSMPALSDLIEQPDTPARQTALDATAARSAILVGIAAWLARSRAVAGVGGLVVAVEWWLYRRAAAAHG